MSYSAQPYRQQRPARRKGRYAIAVLALVVLAVAIFAWANSSNKAQITQSQTKPTVIVGNKTYNGKYMSFTYSGMYIPKAVQLNSSQLEATLLKADTSYDKYLAITVSALPGGGISADSGYLTRKAQPDKYSSSQLVVDGGTATDWIRNDGSEQAIYIPHGNVYAVLAFSVSNTNDSSGLQPEVSALLQSFHWK